MSQRGKLSDERYEEIKQLILDMYEETETDKFPIDCFEIAKKLRYVVTPYSELNIFSRKAAFEESDESYSKIEMNPFTGMYYYAIYYNDSIRSVGRIRWSIFHEIGHIYCGHHDNPYGDEEREEDEANFFAKYAMCPPPLLYKAGCHCPEDVLLKFDTSSEFSNYAYAYFKNWYEYGPRGYLPYEVKMLKQFHFNVA